MDGKDLLAEQFERHRAHLRAVAYRMLGSFSEADDALQETWLRISRAETGDVEKGAGWLTTVVARVCDSTTCWDANRPRTRRNYTKTYSSRFVADVSHGIHTARIGDRTHRMLQFPRIMSRSQVNGAAVGDATHSFPLLNESLSAWSRANVHPSGRTSPSPANQTLPCCENNQLSRERDSGMV
jgi:hypothetical protein